MAQFQLQKAIAILFILLLCPLAAHTTVVTSQSARIAILPFTSLDIDTSLSSKAEKNVKNILVNEGSFQLVSVSHFEETQKAGQNEFFKNGTLQELMKKQEVDMMFEGVLKKAESGGVHIHIRITTKSSNWRPPTLLSTTASTPEYVIPRTESLIRQFLNRYYDEQSMERFFQSALVPGFGQFREGYVSRGGFFFFGTVGLIAGSFLLDDGDPYSGQGAVEFKQGIDGSIRWFIGDTPVSPEEAEAELQRRADAEDSREKARHRKLFLVGAGIALYAVNLYDILKITKRYDRVERRRLSLQLNPLSPISAITLTYNFNL